jgi:hypothetical protein
MLCRSRSGRSLGTGRIHGLWQIIEGALLASGHAGSRRVKDAYVSFVGANAPIVTARHSSSYAITTEACDLPTALRSASSGEPGSNVGRIAP